MPGLTVPESGTNVHPVTVNGVGSPTGVNVTESPGASTYTLDAFRWSVGLRTSMCTDFCCCSPFTYAVVNMVPDEIMTFEQTAPLVDVQATLSDGTESETQRHLSSDMSTG